MTVRQLASQLRERLDQPFEKVDDLIQVLSPPLCFLGFAPPSPSYTQSEWALLSVSDQLVFISKHLPWIQQCLLNTIYIDWHDQLVEIDQFDIVFNAWFLPDHDSLLAISTNLSACAVIGNLLSPNSATHQQIAKGAVNLASELARLVALDRIYAGIIQHPIEPIQPQQQLDWSDAVKTVFSFPARIANVKAIYPDIDTPMCLDQSQYMAALASSYARLIDKLANVVVHQDHLELLRDLLSKFVTTGFMSSSQHRSSFWVSVLPLKQPQPSLELWQRILTELPTTQYTTSFSSMTNLFLTADFSLSQFRQTPYSVEPEIRRRIVACALLLQQYYGSFAASTSDSHVHQSSMQSAMKQLFLQSQFDAVLFARVLLAWIRVEGNNRLGLCWMINTVLLAWVDRTSIEKADFKHREFLTFLMLLCVTALPKSDQAVERVSCQPSFLQAIQYHLTSMRQPVRYLGMLAAEVMSEQANVVDGDLKPLSFGKEIWSNAQAPEALELRRYLLAASDIDSVDIHEAVLAFDNTQTALPLRRQTEAQQLLEPIKFKTSRTKATPTPKIQVLSSNGQSDEDDLEAYELPEEDIDEDVDLEDLSTFTPGKKKVKAPVYISDLSAYLRSSEDPDKIDIALKNAALLVRKKTGWGKELDENAVDLTFALIGLHDNFELADFDRNREDALVALVVSCPRKVAPTLIEQYFQPHYATLQKISMLAAISRAARHLGGHKDLAVAEQTFPSAQLPPALHKKLLSENASENTTLSRLVDSTVSSALLETRSNAEGRIPGAGKEKMLSTRLRQTGHSQIVKTGKQDPQYLTLAEEYFIMPIINRMWSLLQEAPHFSHGGRTMSDLDHLPLFSPPLLSNYFNSLSILMDQSRHALTFLAILVPEALQLVLAVSSLNTDSTVQASQARLALVMLTASNAQDKGRTLLRKSRDSLFGIKDWAESIWDTSKDRGTEVGPTQQAVAGILLCIDEILSI